eukprot:3184428-Prymnesium_polylepis.1
MATTLGTYTGGAGSRVQAVTHINSYEKDAPQLEGAASPAELLAKLDTGKPKDVNGFVRNPKLVREDAAKLKRELEYLRETLDGASRVAQAEELKAGANAWFSKGHWRGALVGYLTGVWFLRRGSDCPRLVSHALSCSETKDADFKTALGEVCAVLGASAPGAEHEEAEGAAALRTSLHLNLAAAALKLAEWPIARTACECVLAGDAAHGKALYRLAKAHEGEGELGKAVAAVMALIKGEPQNRDARSLLDALKKRQAEEKGMFKG